MEVASHIEHIGGWEIPNPVNALNETEARFPFASLKPAGDDTSL